MKTVDVKLNRLAARQYSLAHHDQVLELGMSPHQLQARVAPQCGRPLEASWR